ncbi:MAG: LysM peptidoglycan-binding domain-containing protein [Rhodocyclaceae bacterium]|nr:LysM peptidoglycan-binding domain-containing protein [Rhodocyclaceae bacterium]
MRHIIFALIFGFSTVAALAQSAPAARPIELAPDAPDRHIVVRGDTLWGIAAKFLKDPFRWPEIWRMNAEQIKNPHRIYPGQVVVLDKSGAEPQLKLATVKLSPEVRAEPLDDAIPAIPPQAIEPFLSQPLVIDVAGFGNAPRIVGTQDGRVFTGNGDLIYTTPVDPEIRHWQIYRPGKPFVDPDTQEVLGLDAIYLGNARATNAPGEVTTLEITRVKQEIGRGDFLTPADRPIITNYMPHPPAKDISGRILTIYGGVGEGGAHSIVTLNRGKNDGVEMGHVFALHRAGATVVNRFEDDRPQTHVLPDERYGLAFVFRVFDRVSYALVMESARSVLPGDRFSKP